MLKKLIIFLLIFSMLSISFIAIIPITITNATPSINPTGNILEIPSSYDLSTQSAFPIVGDQLTGDCTSWACTYYDYGYMYGSLNGWTQAKTGNITELFSPQFTFNRQAYYDYDANAAILKADGDCTQNYLAYNAGNLTSLGDSNAIANALTHKELVSYSFITFNTSEITNIKTKISSNVPVMFAISAGDMNNRPIGCMVNNDMMAQYYNTSYTINHAVLIVGYDDSKQNGSFKCVTSWGTGSFEQGYFWIQYDCFKKIGYVANPMYLTLSSSPPANNYWSPTFTNSPSITGTYNTFYSYHPTINETGTFTLIHKPSWLNWYSSNNTLSGTAQTGSFVCSIESTSTTGLLNSYKNWTLTISSPSNQHWSPTFTNSPVTNEYSNVIYTYDPTINETGTFTLISKPSWLAWNTGSFSVYGITQVGTFSCSIKATSTLGTLSSYINWTITIIPTPTYSQYWSPIFTNSPITSIANNSFYSYQPTLNETGTFTLINKPSWLNWYSSNNTLSGIAPHGTFSCSLKATSTDGTLSSYDNWTITIGIGSNNIIPSIVSSNYNTDIGIALILMMFVSFFIIKYSFSRTNNLLKLLTYWFLFLIVCGMIAYALLGGTPVSITT